VTAPDAPLPTTEEVVMTAVTRPLKINMDQAEQAQAPLASVETMAAHYQQILTGLGEDVGREGLVDTPTRAVKALKYLTRGYSLDLQEIVNNALFASENDEMVLLKDIELYSLCEHHVLPVIGKAHVAYLPNGRVIGLSKIARIVDMFAARLQIQENMTRQIADAIMEVTGARGVAVVVEAKHMCMTMRGIEKQNSSMTTSVMLGAFREDPRTREEFLDLIRR
jgi:GTP cyclohydrolase IA